MQRDVVRDMQGWVDIGKRKESCSCEELTKVFDEFSFSFFETFLASL